MRVKIVRKNFGGVEFCPEVRVLHLGGQSSAGVQRLEFALPEEWKGKSVTLHIQRQDGTLPAPILLDENSSAEVGKAFTASPCGSWMLMALGENGYRALTRPAKYDCYETFSTDGDAEISPTQYETFVAQVLSYANSAQDSAKEARNSAAAANRDAAAAETARDAAQTAEARAEIAQGAAESGAQRAEDAAARAELMAPADGAVRSVNGKGGAVLLTAEDVGAVDEDSAGYVKRIEIAGRTVTVTMGDGSTRTMQTKDTTALGNMTGILDTEHGGTGKSGALTAEDVGAAEKTTTETALADRYRKKEVDQKFTDMSAQTDQKLTDLRTEVDTKLEAQKLSKESIETALGYSIEDKLKRLERMMDMTGKLVYSGTGVTDNYRITKVTLPSTVDYIEFREASPHFATETNTNGGICSAFPDDFGVYKIAKGGSARVGAKISNGTFTVSFLNTGVVEIGNINGFEFNILGYQYV